jgi:hypothetical protein
MVNWRQLFNKNARQNPSDSWAEYTGTSLKGFMKSDFMQKFAEDCANTLKEAGRPDYNDYDAIKVQMGKVLMEYNYPPLDAMEDAYEEDEQLRMLQEFKQKYQSPK